MTEKKENKEIKIGWTSQLGIQFEGSVDYLEYAMDMVLKRLPPQVPPQLLEAQKRLEVEEEERLAGYS